LRPPISLYFAEHIDLNIAGFSAGSIAAAMQIAMTRSIWSGTSTWRPAESTTSLPAVAGKRARVANMPAHASRIEAALSLLAGNALRKLRADRLTRRASGA